MAARVLTMPAENESSCFSLSFRFHIETLKFHSRTKLSKTEQKMITSNKTCEKQKETFVFSVEDAHAGDTSVRLNTCSGREDS